MPDPADELRAHVGEGMMQMLDRIDDEMVSAVQEYAPHLQALATALESWDATDRVQFLVGMAINAGLNTDR